MLCCAMLRRAALVGEGEGTGLEMNWVEDVDRLMRVSSQ